MQAKSPSKTLVSRRFLLKSLGVCGASMALAPVLRATPALASTGGFSDVPDWHWAAKSGVIDYAVDRGLFGGYGDGRFGPDDPVTRGQACIVMYKIVQPEVARSIKEVQKPKGCKEERVKAFNSLNNTYTSDFINNTGLSKVIGKYFQNAVLYCYGLGLIKGYGTYTVPGYEGKHVWDSTNERYTDIPLNSEPDIRPDNSVTRQELAAMLVNLAKYRGDYDASDVDYARLDSFPDVGAVGTWARDAMAWAVGRGLLGGGGYLNPNGTATRAECAKMFMVYLEGEGFSPIGHAKHWVTGRIWWATGTYKCTACGATSTKSEKDIQHKPGCPWLRGEEVLIQLPWQDGDFTYDWHYYAGEDEPKPTLVNGKFITEFENYGVLTGWYEYD